MNREERDRHFLQHTIRIAKRNIEKGFGGPFGCIIVKDDIIIAESGNLVLISKDPTAHAEITAIREASRRLQNFSLEGCTIYSSCEPCPMCMAAIYWARIDRLVFSASRDDAAEAGFDDELIYREMMLPLNERAVPMERKPLPEALEVMKSWQLMANKITY